MKEFGPCVLACSKERPVRRSSPLVLQITADELSSWYQLLVCRLAVSLSGHRVACCCRLVALITVCGWVQGYLC